MPVSSSGYLDTGWLVINSFVSIVGRYLEDIVVEDLHLKRIGLMYVYWSKICRYNKEFISIQTTEHQQKAQIDIDFPEKNEFLHYKQNIFNMDYFSTIGFWPIKWWSHHVSVIYRTRKLVVRVLARNALSMPH